MYLCDLHGAVIVNRGKARPLVEVWGANNIPWKRCKCEYCKEESNCSPHPGINYGDVEGAIKELRCEND